MTWSILGDTESSNWWADWKGGYHLIEIAQEVTEWLGVSHQSEWTRRLIPIIRSEAAKTHCTQSGTLRGFSVMGPLNVDIILYSRMLYRRLVPGLVRRIESLFIIVTYLQGLPCGIVRACHVLSYFRTESGRALVKVENRVSESNTGWTNMECRFSNMKVD